MLHGVALVAAVVLGWNAPAAARQVDAPQRESKLAQPVVVTTHPLGLAAARELEAERKPTGKPDVDVINALHDLGSDVIEPLLDMLVVARLPNADGSASKSINERQRDLVLGTLASFHPQATLRGIETRLANTPTRAARLAGLSVYGAVGSGAHIARVVDIAFRGEHGPFDRLAERGLQQCIAAILRRDADALLGLSQRILSAPPEVHKAMLFALGDSRDVRGQSTLLQMLKMRPELADVIIAQVRVLGAPLEADVRDSLGQELMRYVDVERPELCASALRALGEIEEEDAIAHFLDLLEHDHRSIREGALTALRRISRLQLSDTAATWRIWYTQQRDWWDGPAAVMLRDLDSNSRVARLLALEGLSKATIYRDEIAEYLVPLASDGDVLVRRRACSALASLGMRAAAPALLEALSDSDEEVQRLARAGLESMFGVVLPEEVFECRTLLRL